VDSVRVDRGLDCRLVILEEDLDREVIISTSSELEKMRVVAGGEFMISTSESEGLFSGL
jgi:hypothetical protein